MGLDGLFPLVFLFFIFFAFSPVSSPCFFLSFFAVLSFSEERWEFHFDPFCADPIQNLPILTFCTFHAHNGEPVNNASLALVLF